MVTILLLLSFPLYASFPVCTSVPLCASFPLCASSIYFLSMLPSKRGGERGKGREERGEREGERVRINRLIFCVFLKEERREREREQKKEKEALASPFVSIFKIDYPCNLQDP